VTPDFTLKDQQGKEFKLSDFRGKRVLLSFHPPAWTKVYNLRMQALKQKFDVFKPLNMVPVGINVNPIPSERA